MAKVIDVSASITGIQELQAWNIRAIAALKPSGAAGEAVRWGTTEAHRHTVAITHVDTGTLRAAHRMTIEERGKVRGRIFIDRSARNPRTGQRPAVYGVVEHRRGGTHAFYGHTLDEAGNRIAKGMQRIVIRGLK